MKLHPLVVTDLIQQVKNLSGLSTTAKLRERVAGMRFAIYTGDRRDMVLVDANQYIQECIQRRLPTGSIVPMALHVSSLNKILYYADLYGGYDGERRLREALQNMDFTPYERKTVGDTILVLTEEFTATLAKHS